MIKWWVALIIGIISLFLGYSAGVSASRDVLKRSENLLAEVDSKLKELKETYECLTKEHER